MSAFKNALPMVRSIGFSTFLFLLSFSSLNAQTCTWDYLGSQGISAGTGEWTALEYNPVTGDLYLAFQDEANGSRITVMKHDGSSWSTVGSPGFSAGEAYHPDIEFDSTGNIYVLYRGLPNFSYTVNTFNGAEWTTVGNADFTGSSNGGGTLAIHPITDELYMAYPDLDNSMSNRLSVRKFDGANWNFVGTQGITASGVGYSDIQFDSSGTPHVAFSVFADNGKLSVMSFDGTNWNFVGSPAFTNNTSGNASYGAALQFHPITGEPWVVTRVAGNIIDAYSFTGGVWTDDNLPNYAATSFNQRIGFQFDADGNPFFAIKRYNVSPLFVASVIAKKEGSWDYVGGNQISEDQVTHVALTLTPAGDPVIAFRDNSTNGGGKISVMAANCTIEGCTNPAACNYNADANFDDGSCLIIEGCTDPIACNYDAAAQCDDGTCILPDGCTDATAINFDPTAQCDDGSCIAQGSALNFAGTSDFVNIPSDATVNFGTNNFSVECWFRMESKNDFSSLLSAFNTFTGGWALHRNNVPDGANEVVFLVGADASSNFEQVSSGPLNLGEWYHVAGVKDQNEIRLYINGTQTGAIPSNRTVPLNNLHLGRRYTNTSVWGHNGDLDEVRVWSKALTEAEINSYMNCQLTGNEGDIVRYYQFNQGEAFGDNAGVSALVSSDSDNPVNGTLVSFSLNGTSSNWVAGQDNQTTCVVLLAGCTDETACNYNVEAVLDDGSCESTSCVGCTDPLADNYEVDNTTDDGSCAYCEATLNFNTTGPEPILIGDGISNNHMAVASNCNVSASIKAIERFVGDIIPTDGLYRVEAGESPTSGMDATPDAGKAKWNYVFSANLGTFTAEDVKIFLDVDFDPAVAVGAVYTADVSQFLIDNGLAASSLAQDSQNLGFDFWQLLGDPAIIPFDPFANGLYDLTLRIETLSGVELVNAPIQVEVFTPGCTDPSACNYDPNATDNDGSCLNVLGCTDSEACNYNAAANCDDGLCEYTSCLGCTNPAACEFDPTALIEDGSCLTFPGDACDDGNIFTENDQVTLDCLCEGTPIDTDGDGLSDEDEINIYLTDPLLQDSDYDGLTDGLEISLSNTNPLDPDSDGDGCGDAEAFAGLCPGQEDCVGDFNDDGLINSTDLLIFLGVFGSNCP